MKAIEFCNLSEEQKNQFSLNGKIAFEDKYIDQSSEDQQRLLDQYYSKEIFNKFIKQAQRRAQNYYGETDLFVYSALDMIKIKNKSVLVVGSTQPWYEAIAVARDCKSCDVVEYGDRISFNDRVRYIKPGQEKKYDVIISISSFEHDGLGRYGDPINPNADIESMQRMKQHLNQGGHLVLSVPVGLDKVVWNAHRVYGNVRFPMLIDGWSLIESFGFITSR